MKTCRDITENIEKASVKRLSIGEKLEVRMHLRICKNCRQYSKDSKILERMIRHITSSHYQHEFTPDEKQALIRKLRGDQ